MKKRKYNKFFVCIISILLVGILLSSLSFVFDFSDVILPPEIDEEISDVPGTDEPDVPGTDEPDVPENRIPVAEFGGEVLLSTDFSTGSANDYVSISVGGFSHSISTGAYMIADSGTIGEFHSNLYVSNSKKSAYISDYSYVMIDFDLNLEQLNDSFYFYVNFKDSITGATASSPGDCHRYLAIRKSENGCELSVYNHSEKLICGLVQENESNHLTLIYRFKEDLKYSDCFLYLNGDYIGTIERFATADFDLMTSFRIHQSSNNNEDIDVIYIDNYSVHGFAKGYEGALNYLFEDTEYTLQECSDSILFENNQ